MNATPGQTLPENNFLNFPQKSQEDIEAENLRAEIVRLRLETEKLKPSSNLSLGRGVPQLNNGLEVSQF